MNKSELINEICLETTQNKKDVVAVFESACRIIMRTLKKGSKVSITGFGSFRLSYRPQRKGINPATKTEITLPAISVPTFKAGKDFKEAVRFLFNANRAAGKPAAASIPVKSKSQ